MGEAMEAADPSIKSTLLKCMRQPATTLSVQLAAIQAFRRMQLTDEVNSTHLSSSQYVLRRLYTQVDQLCASVLPYRCVPTSRGSPHTPRVQCRSAWLPT